MVYFYYKLKFFVMSTQVSLKQVSPQILEHLHKGEIFWQVYWYGKNVQDKHAQNLEEIYKKFEISQENRRRAEHYHVDFVALVKASKELPDFDLGNAWYELHQFLCDDTKDVSYLTQEKSLQGKPYICVNAVLGALQQFKYEGYYRFLTSAQVAEVATLLPPIFDGWRERSSFLDLELQEFTDDEGEDFETFFRQFVAYCVSAAAQGHGMLIMIG
jgi:hypothetical protein